MELSSESAVTSKTTAMHDYDSKPNRQYPHLSPAALSEDAYMKSIRNALTYSRQQAQYYLLGLFNDFCLEHEISYFAIADTLSGAVAYKGFIPGKATLEVGMLRSDYDKLVIAYSEYATKVTQPMTDLITGLEDCLRHIPNPECKLPLEFYCSLDEKGLHPKHLPIIKLSGSCMACEEGTPLFGSRNTPILFDAEILISIFDAVPDDYDASRMLFKRLALLEKYSKRNDISTEVSYILKDRAWKIAGCYNDKPHREVARLIPKRSKSIPVNSLFPLQAIPFGNTTICCPRETDTWVIYDVKKQTEQVEILQRGALSIALEIDRICRTHNIGYFICGGTMLGYVRHGGFIPWDDDIDVGMLRADYERFVKIASEELDADRFFLQTRESDPNIPYLFSKVRLKGSEYITKYNQFRSFDKGICVDVFPFDRVPLGNGQLSEFRTEVNRVIRAHNKLANRQIGSMPSTKPTTLADQLAREIMSVRHEWYRNKSLAKTQKAYDETVTRYNGDNDCEYVASFVPTFTMTRLDDLLPYQDVQFEGATLMAPANPEIFLKMQYGDFMTLPMPHQQRGHNLIWWSTEEHDASEFGINRPDYANPELHESWIHSHQSTLIASTLMVAGVASIAGVVKSAVKTVRKR